MYQTDQEKDNQVKVWDLSLRVFHIILIILIIGSIISAKLDMLNIHEYFGVSILGLIILLQIILGILTVLSGASILMASLHQFSSILLITSSLYFLYKNRFS